MHQIRRCRGEHSLACQRPRIQLQNVAKTFTAKGRLFTAVEALDLAINPGEFVVLVGPSGCGKTTTLRMIAGPESPTAGRIFIDGKDVTDLRPGDRDIAFVFQMFALYPHLTAEDNIAFPLQASGLPKSEIEDRRDRVIHRLGLESIRYHKPSQLAGGDQQRVSLARAMVREPKAFLMDELFWARSTPTSASTRAPSCAPFIASSAPPPFSSRTISSRP